ncbi:hypothetical protein Fleli_2542 [Bernardetia litoralis DSM 6794]|uniref:Uncharacterized protein n=1 Tax=Bernardetia litoralis (strain ATCC 23117 / DSM 6794 / NBRC 15988 / NCIMB 1366 / Fx l1 / Sio-4) TaxID=880071 RepID=I4ALS2_BERLS|nr:hypothetical protein [Bernardetia litoralis]AFM04907.1 hypothetical protein Fleli_2542 [Bernardetia litoralis DSM 6794]
MLDFYFIEESQSKPNSPKNLDFAGGLDFNVFKRLQNKSIIPSSYDYYSDFRWDLNTINQMIEKIKDDNDQDKKILFEIIVKAHLQYLCLIAYCD